MPRLWATMAATKQCPVICPVDACASTARLGAARGGCTGAAVRAAASCGVPATKRTAGGMGDCSAAGEIPLLGGGVCSAAGGSGRAPPAGKMNRGLNDRSLAGGSSVPAIGSRHRNKRTAGSGVCNAAGGSGRAPPGVPATGSVGSCSAPVGCGSLTSIGVSKSSSSIRSGAIAPDDGTAWARGVLARSCVGALARSAGAGWLTGPPGGITPGVMWFIQ